MNIRIFLLKRANLVEGVTTDNGSINSKCVTDIGNFSKNIITDTTKCSYITSFRLPELVIVVCFRCLSPLLPRLARTPS